jgi:hypothetical protein
MTYAYAGSYREQREVADYRYLRIEKTAGSVFNYYASRDGLTWSLQFTEGNSWIESSGTVNWVGIFIGCNTTNINITASFSWFRYNWTADFDATLHH